MSLFKRIFGKSNKPTDPCALVIDADKYNAFVASTRDKAEAQTKAKKAVKPIHEAAKLITTMKLKAEIAGGAR